MAAAAGEDGERALQEQAVTTLLRVARSKISEADEEGALAALLHAVRLTQGESAIQGVLDTAKARADAEATDAEDARTVALRMSALLVADTSTVLYQRGQEGLLQAAFEDGSSVVCSQCDALVPRARFMQHKLYWCEHATGGEGDLVEDDSSDGGGGGGGGGDGGGAGADSDSDEFMDAMTDD